MCFNVHFEYTPHHIHQLLLQSSRRHMRRNTHFWPGELDLWHNFMTLTFELELKNPSSDIHVEFQVCISVHTVVRSRHKDTQTDRYTDVGGSNEFMRNSNLGGLNVATTCICPSSKLHMYKFTIKQAGLEFQYTQGHFKISILSTYANVRYNERTPFVKKNKLKTEPL